MKYLKYSVFIITISFLFYLSILQQHHSNQISFLDIEKKQSTFLKMIQRDHAKHIAIKKAKKIAKQEAERRRIEEIKALEKRKRLAALAAKQERLRKAKEAARKKALALERKRNRVVAKVDISQQRMRVYKGGKLLHKWKVSTGKKGFNTPTGIFKPTTLEKLHLSKQYNNAPMPYSVFFNGGIAVHGTKSVRRLGRRASHGCIRVKTPHAKELFALVQKSGRDNAYIEVFK